MLSSIQIRNDEFHAVPLGHVHVPPVQLVPLTQLVALSQMSPAPAALRQVVVLTGLCGQDVQESPNMPRSRHV